MKKIKTPTCRKLWFVFEYGIYLNGNCTTASFIFNESGVIFQLSYLSDIVVAKCVEIVPMVSVNLFLVEIMYKYY
jgi:hypothetical protein